ncbi:trypsin-like serine protease [Vibrio sp. WXL210]|uniref:trypsin-like serine protease n=1 Tax=Vibrio sp. WXL210 TaxID=3450709 RepID=UPI003EC8EAEA
MKTKSTFTLFAAATLYTGAVVAEEVRTPVSQDDYKDFMVALSIPLQQGYGTKTCGGALLGENYILTATHCIGSGWVGDAITITQGLSRSNPTRTWVRDITHIPSHSGNTVGDTLEFHGDYYYSDIEPLWVNGEFTGDFYANESNMYNDFNYEYYRSFGDEPWGEDVHRDLSLLKLDESIHHSDSAIVFRTFDGVEDYLQLGEEFTFRGWGTLDSTGTTPDVLMEFTSILTMKPHIVHEWVDTGYLDVMGDPLKVPEPCTLESEKCYYNPGHKNLYYNEKVSVKPGDSGTPLVHNGAIIGVISSNTMGAQDGTKLRSEVISFDAYTDWFVRAIDGLLFPSVVNIDIDEADSATFVVQNFTKETVDTYLNSESIGGVFTVVEDCGFLNSKDGCHVTIEVSSDFELDNPMQTYAIQLTDGDFIQLNLTGTVQGKPGTPILPPEGGDDGANNGSDKDDEEPEEDLKPGTPGDGNNGSSGSSSGSKSGGSMSFGLLTVLAIFSIRRFKFKK